MFRTAAFLTLAFTPLLAAQPAAGDPPARFKWVAGQVHTYQVKQQTVVRETTLDPQTEKPATTEAKTALTLVRKWAVKAVDANDVGTLEMTITAMKNEFQKPDGKSVVIDSANPDDAKQMADYLNVAVMTVKVDPQGRLVEVKEAKPGSAARLHAELPFRLTLPDAGPAAGQKWDRAFTMKLDPPLGTGESYEFTQQYACSGAKDSLLAIDVTTALKAPPKALAERVPLVPMLWQGQVYFNTTAGKYHAARLRSKAELPNYQGEGTKFEYESVYTEDAAEK